MLEQCQYEYGLEHELGHEGCFRYEYELRHDAALQVRVRLDRCVLCMVNNL